MLAVILISGLCCSLGSSDAEFRGLDEQGKLVFTQVLFRHGDRMPVDPYPNDPWRDPIYWPNGWGQLTNTGKQQHFHLGQWLRNRYNSFLNSTYSNNDVYVQSTDVDRTLMSALSNLAGLFPPVGKQIWNEDIAWQPIPVHTIPETSDWVLASKKPCPAYDYAMTKLKHTDEFQKIDRRFSALYEFLTKKTGRKISALEDVEKIYDTFFIEQLYNLTLPDWTKSVYPGDMRWITGLSFTLDTYTRQLARLKAGPLLKEMLERFQDKANNNLNPNRSMWIYSAHDTTIANILNTLKVFERHSPPYASCIMLEMRLITEIPYISVFYKNTTANPIAMNIPGCGPLCPLNKMFELYSDVLPDDWEAECEMSTLSMTYAEADVTSAMAIVACGALFVLAMILIYAGVVYFRRRQYYDYNWYMNIDS